MKKLLLLVLTSFLLSSCGQNNTPKQTETPLNVEAKNAQSQPLTPEQIGQLGDACGPDIDKVCGQGLSCLFEGNNKIEGQCLTIVVNPDLQCDDTQAPVCGLIGNNKNGYLNECYAQRFGATVVNQGLCTADENTKNNCEAAVYSIGNCQKSHTGFWVNPQSGQCETTAVVGCEAEIPFETQQACEATCQ